MSARSPSPKGVLSERGVRPDSPASSDGLPSDVPPSSLHAVPRADFAVRNDTDTALLRIDGAQTNLSQFLASCIIIEKTVQDSADLWLFWVYQIFEWMSFFSVIYLAQWTSHLFLLLVLLAMYSLAVLRSSSWHSPLLRPIYLFVPERHSCLGLCHEQQSAMFYQCCAATLRLGSLALWVLLITSIQEDEDICVVPVTNFEDQRCQDVPMWLSSGCGTFFAPKQWRQCVAGSWMKYGYCNLLAAQCRNQALGSINLPISIFFTSGISLLSVLAPFLWLGTVVWLSLRKGFCIFSTPKATELAMAIREAEIDLAEDLDQSQVFVGPALKRLMRFDLLLTLADLVSDVLVFFVFAFAYNWPLAFLQLILISTTAATVFGRKGGTAQALWMELKKAYESSVFTEDYLNCILLERQRRCPLSLFLTLYGSMFVTSNMLVALIFLVSIMSSLLSAVQGGVLHIQLDLETAPWSLNV